MLKQNEGKDMDRCELQATGAIELYFYKELDPAEHASVEQHLAACAECRRALDELAIIRAALAARPTVDAPPDGDWRGFMVRLDDAIGFERQVRGAAAAPVIPIKAPERRTLKYAPYLAAAAALTLVTSGIVYFGRPTERREPFAPRVAETTPAPATTPALVPAAPRPSSEAAFAALSEQHFERSKLVVLGLANKDSRLAREEDWAYERSLASNLLSDTRVYRMAAEERGMKDLADVMGDLELVLLQTSLANRPDPATLEQIQRLIHKRNLVTKMDVTTGS